MSPRVDTERNKTERALELLIILISGRRIVRWSELPRERWGSAKTIERTVQAINDVWERQRGQRLLEIVRESCSEEKIIRVIDGSVSGRRRD